MFHLTLSNLVLILILCSTLNTIQIQGFEFATWETSNSITIRVWYKNYKYLLKSLNLRYVGNSTSTEYIMQGEKDFVIGNLEACTTYNIVGKLLNKKKNKVFTQNLNITTVYADPSTIIEKVIPNEDSVNVTIKYQNYNCIDSSEIFIDDTKHSSFMKSDLPENYFFDQLEPCTSYTLSVVTHFGKPLKKANTTQQFTTKSVTLPPIENMDFDVEAGLLTWDKFNFGQKCIKNYDITIKSDVSTKSNTSYSESYDLNGEPACSKLKISVTPRGINDEMNTTSTSISIQTKSKGKEPSALVNLNGNASSNNITISWNSPLNNPDCVDSYAVQYDEQIEYTQLLKYTIHNLESCRMYQIKVCVVMSNNKSGHCNEINVNTTVETPGNVVEIQSSFSNQINVTWKPPLKGANCIKTYWIKVHNMAGEEINTDNVTTPQIQINPELFEACRNYTVSIIPINHDNVMGEENSTIITTEPSKPDPPRAPELVSKTATSLELQSYYQIANYSCPLKTASFKCQEIDIDEYKHEANRSLFGNEQHFTANVTNLKDNAKYKCVAAVTNSKYSSDSSESAEYETNEIPSDPPTITIVSANSSSFCFQWKTLNSRTKVQRYRVNVTKVGKNYQTRDGCNDNVDDSEKLYVIDSNVSYYKIDNLEPFTNYTIQMAIENTAGIGNFSAPVDVITKPDIPHQVSNFHIANVNENQTIELAWNLPCDINGQIVALVGKIYEGEPLPRIYDWKYEVKDELLPTNYIIPREFQSEYFYNITISIELDNLIGLGNETSISFRTPAGIPDAFQSEGWGSAIQEISSSKTVTLTINTTILSSTKGTILYYTFLISERICQEDPKPSQMFFVNGQNYTDLLTWYDVVDDECTRQYRLELYPNNHTSNETDSFQFVIGNERCNKKVQPPQYCNGPVKSGTEYAVVARVFTDNGYADTKPICIVTEKSKTTLIVIFLVLSTLLAGFFGGIGFMRFKAKYMNVPVTLTDISVKSFLTFYSHMEFDLIVKEYHSINALDLKEFKTTEAAKYKEKNRYTNILPYDQNRVILTPNAYCTSDYINASYINGYKRKQEYIASQGPKPETAYDFWNMIIETKCHKIVMLTKLNENDTTKCFQYYPDAGTDLEFNDINITNMKDDDLEIFTRRELKITKGIAKRMVVQYHFQKWPDHDCPENEMDLIRFIQFLKSDNSSTHPIVVHCSAGVGRTGTLISLDILMQQVQNDKYLNIYETVKKLRYQRIKMVQNFEQYEFLYKSVAKYVQWKWPTSKS